MNIITIILTLVLIIVICLISFLFIKHNNLKKTVKNVRYEPSFAPIDVETIRNQKTVLKELRMDRLRKIISFKWTWYWLTKKSKEERKTKKEFNEMMSKSIEKRKKMKILSDINNQKDI